MNILLVLRAKPIKTEGGVQRSVHKIGTYFQNSGHNVTVLTFDKTEINNEIIDGLKVYYLPDEELFSDINKAFCKTLFETNDIKYIINFIGWKLDVTQFLYAAKNENVKLVNSYRNSLFSYLDTYKDIFKRRYGKKPYSLLINNTVSYEILKFYHIFKYRAVFTKMLRIVDMLILQSVNYIPELKFFHKKFPAEKVMAIGNPMDIPAVSGELNKKNQLLFVGRMDFEQKRPDLLLQVWEKLQDKHPDWSLCFVGDGPYLERLKQMAAELGLKRISFEGFQDPESYYATSKIFCMTSAFEGFGNVKIEAQCYGTVPVLFDTYAAASEMVNDGTDAFLIKPFDTESYADKVSFLINHPDTWQEMSTNARRNVLKYEFNAVGKQWVNMLEKLP